MADLPQKRVSRISDRQWTKRQRTNRLNRLWTNRQRVLVFGSRGIGHRDRHLMEDLRSLLPQSKADSKMERKESLFAINEIAEMKNCNKCLFFEGRKRRRDLFLWASNVARGPSAKFLVENIHTMAELKMTGNCLKSSRPLLSFDQSFGQSPHLQLVKELFTQVQASRPYFITSTLLERYMNSRSSPCPTTIPAVNLFSITSLRSALSTTRSGSGTSRSSRRTGPWPK